MSCTATLLTESHEEPVLKRNGSNERMPEGLRRRRRHSSYHPHHWAADTENMHLVVDRFLAELNRRLEFIESYGQLNIDAGIEAAWSTLHAVRDSCSRVRDDVMDAGKRRAAVFVETLEARYNEALAQRETLEQKVYDGVKLMEAVLAECEAKAQIMRESTFSSAVVDFVESSRSRAHTISQSAKDAVDAGLARAWRAAEEVEATIEQALAKAQEHGLIRYHDLPVPWRTNPHIHRGYRFNTTKMGCVYSVVKPSNELFNIWSHLIGLIIVLSIAFYFYPTSAHFTIATKTDVFIAGVFFFAACKCLVCSCMWHTFNSIAEQNLMERFACVDYTGISMLVAASIMTTEYTAFYCEPVSRWLWISITAFLGLAGVGLAWHPTFNRADMQWLRVGFYMLLAATGGLPVVQLAYTRGLAWAGYFYAPITKSLVVYTSGALLYALKVPERWSPGMFDYLGGSHNIWHMAVLGGILFHYHAMQEFFAQAFLRAFNQCSAW